MGRQIGTSPGRSNGIFRGRPGDVGGGRPRDVLETNICRLGTGLTKSDLKYILLRSQKHHTETKCSEYLESDPVHEIKFKITEIRKYLIELGMLLDKADRVIIKKMRRNR